MESGGPSSGRDAALNVAGRLGITGACTAHVSRPATELSFGRLHGSTGVATPRPWPAVGLEGHEGCKSSGRGRRALIVPCHP
jgi:hypothetical protein